MMSFRQTKSAPKIIHVFPVLSLSACSHLLHSLVQQFQLPGHFIWQVIVHLGGEILPHFIHLPQPELLIEGEQLFEVHIL